MTNRILAALFFVVYTHLSANAKIALSDMSLQNYSGTTANSNAATMPGLSRLSYAHFFWAADLGYGHGKITTDSNKTTGGSFMFRGELGAKIEVAARSSNRSHIISLGAALSTFSMKIKSKPLSFVTVSMPVSYSIYGYSLGEGGFYCQLGTALSYLGEVKYRDRNVINGYNRFYFEPFLSVGLHGPFSLWRRGSQVGGGRIFYGPFFSYAPMNLSNETGVSTHIYSVGFRWIYMYM